MPTRSICSFADANHLPIATLEFSYTFANIADVIDPNGGRAGEVTQSDFAISDTISGVNMRLTSGGIREMHWHQFTERPYLTNGNCRMTALDEAGRPYIAHVKEGDLWYFPAGFPHSLQGPGPDGCEVIHAFDEGHASELFTLLVFETVIAPLPLIQHRHSSEPRWRKATRWVAIAATGIV